MGASVKFSSRGQRQRASFSEINVTPMVDVMLVLLLFLPSFGNGADDPSSISLFALSGINPWAKAVFAVVVVATIICGLCEVFVSYYDKSYRCRALLAIGVVLSVVCVAVFIVARQPYAGIFSFALLVAKSLLLIRRTNAR